MINVKRAWHEIITNQWELTLIALVMIPVSVKYHNIKITKLQSNTVGFNSTVVVY